MRSEVIKRQRRSPELRPRSEKKRPAKVSFHEGGSACKLTGYLLRKNKPPTSRKAQGNSRGERTWRGVFATIRRSMREEASRGIGGGKDRPDKGEVILKRVGGAERLKKSSRGNHSKLLEKRSLKLGGRSPPTLQKPGRVADHITSVYLERGSLSEEDHPDQICDKESPTQALSEFAGENGGEKPPTKKIQFKYPDCAKRRGVSLAWTETREGKSHGGKNDPLGG